MMADPNAWHISSWRLMVFPSFGELSRLRTSSYPRRMGRPPGPSWRCGAPVTKVSTWSPQKYRDRSITAMHREAMDCASVAGSAFMKLFDWSRIAVSAAH